MARVVSVVTWNLNSGIVSGITIRSPQVYMLSITYSSRLMVLKIYRLCFVTVQQLTDESNELLIQQGVGPVTQESNRSDADTSEAFRLFQDVVVSMNRTVQLYMFRKTFHFQLTCITCSKSRCSILIQLNGFKIVQSAW